LGGRACFRGGGFGCLRAEQVIDLSGDQGIFCSIPLDFLFLGERWHLPTWKGETDCAMTALLQSSVEDLKTIINT